LHYLCSMETGLKHTSKLTVTKELTAEVMGSGDMPVLATPAMMALMEHAAMMAVKQELPEDSTTVGGQISASHLKPSPIGAEIVTVAELTKVDGRKLWFHVTAYQGDELIGEGDHLRFIVDRRRFLQKLT
jgi:fluoroacetyl-CoA thioesterase